MRTTVDLTPEHLAKLSEYCQREGVSRAEAIRRAIESLGEAPEEPEASWVTERERRRAALKESFGAWRGRNIDAVEFIRSLRDEWER
jgi:metal-responsive CopG/Arc/MetJ family transcriptional regulator